MTSQPETEKDRVLKEFEARVALDAKHKTQQRKMVRINVEETSAVDAPAHLVSGWAVIKEAGTGRPELTKLNAAVKELIASGKASSTYDAVAKLADTLPDLLLAVQLEEAAAHKGEDPVMKAQTVTKVQPVVKAEGETAQQKILAQAREMFIAGRVNSIAQGVELTAKLYPELADEAMSEGVEGNVL